MIMMEHLLLQLLEEFLYLILVLVLVLLLFVLVMMMIIDDDLVKMDYSLEL
eukprot:CAMPEP_0174825918 /NCGR_PEP_ID=MMETSP1107-20130205/43262_1 /TAXON_ID=36770 /ORGANISM="Paraphysomonas vestita, Strain GFlagA" /LENGTH=50 /DNA_ID=CAMNT_0016058055 /DNA_START=753 /DNA_END=905 /DNA_ORIENTATION=+